MKAGALCPTCGRKAAAHYCANCGERLSHSYSFAHFVEEIFENLFHLDGRVFRTVRSLLFEPGQLARDFLDGRRKPYMGPLQLFLVVNVLYFLVQPFTGFATFTTTLDLHMHNQPWAALATHLVTDTTTSRGIPFEQYRQAFDHAAHLQGKTLVLIMAPLFAFASFALYGRVRRFYAEHLIFAFYLYAFVVVWVTISTLAYGHLVGPISRWSGITPSGDFNEGASSLLTLAPIAAYLFVAIKRVFGQPKTTTVLKTFVLTAAIAGIIVLYRFILFFTTFAAV